MKKNVKSMMSFTAKQIMNRKTIKNTLCGSLKTIRKIKLIKSFQIILILMLFFNAFCLGQKSFTVTMQFPKDFDFKKLSIGYDNGKTEIHVKTPEPQNGKITVSELFYSKYAAIVLNYPRKKNFTYRSSFFLSTIPGQIYFEVVDTTISPFDKYKLVNVYDFRKEIDQMTKNDFNEVKALENIADSLGDKFNQPSDSLFRIEWDNLYRKLYDKDMEYVRQNGGSYYSFWFFRRNLIKPNVLTSDSLMHIFNTIFPDSFKNSEEGNTIKNILNGKVAVKTGNIAPDFLSKDINGNKISLSSFRNKKYVLLTFWATWCGPCKEEIPVLKTIRNKYPIQNLEIISVSYKSTSYQGTVDFIKKEKMDWTNIYNDIDLINSWGGNKPIPRVYLIDKQGKIIYDRLNDEANKLELTTLMKGLDKLKL